MDTARWTILGAVSVSLVAVGVFWYTLPDGGKSLSMTPPQTAAPIPLPRAAASPSPPSPRPDRAKTGARQAKAAKSAKGAKSAKSPRAAKAKVPRDGAAVPEDVLATLDEIRSEKVAKSEAKLEYYAEKAQWSEETTKAVNLLVANAHADVDTLIANATAGDVPWTEVRGEVRQIRMNQARAVRDELGPEEFARFAKAMGRSRGPR